MSLRPGSNITPSYFVAVTLNLIFVLSIRILLFLASFISEFFFVLVNSIALVFLMSKLTAFLALYLITISLTFCRVFTIILIFLAPIIKSRLFMKDRLVT